jgi:hypothetical protein
MLRKGLGKLGDAKNVTLKKSISFNLFPGYLGGEAGLCCEHIGRSSLPPSKDRKLALGEIFIPCEEAKVMGVPEEFLSKFGRRVRTFLCLKCLAETIDAGK